MTPAPDIAALRAKALATKFDDMSGGSLSGHSWEMRQFWNVATPDAILALLDRIDALERERDAANEVATIAQRLRDREGAKLAALERIAEAAEKLTAVADSLYHFPDQQRTVADAVAIAAVIDALSALAPPQGPGAAGGGIVMGDIKLALSNFDRVERAAIVAAESIASDIDELADLGPEAVIHNLADIVGTAIRVALAEYDKGDNA
jgi:hypothetical protein